MNSTSFLFSQNCQCGEFSQVWCSPDRPEVLGARPPMQPCVSSSVSDFPGLGFLVSSELLQQEWLGGIHYEPLSPRNCLSLAFICTTQWGQPPSLLVSAPDNWASASPTDSVPFQPSPLQRRPVTSAGFLWFLQIIFWLSFSVWELMFSSHLCSLKTVRMFWDVIHFPLISMCCSKPFGLWSLFLLMVIKAINWLELYILLDTYVDAEQERAWKCQTSFQFMSDHVDGFS